MHTSLPVSAVDNLGSRMVNTTSDNPFTSYYSAYSINITIMVLAVLDAPVLFCPSLSKYSTIYLWVYSLCTDVVVTYEENAAPIYVFSGLTITSIETDYLMSATVELVAEVSCTQFCVRYS